MNTQEFGRPTWVEFDIGVIEHNIAEFKKMLGNDISLIISCKGNSQGNGCVAAMAKILEESPIWGFATGSVYAAVDMRRAGVKKPIQLFAHLMPEAARLLVEYDLQPTFVNPGDAAEFLAVLGPNCPLDVWVKVDTGMGRFGIRPNEVLPVLEYMRENTSFQVQGIFSHIGAADADYPEKDANVNRQIKTMEELVASVKANGYQVPHFQITSTFTSQAYPNGWFNTVCAGNGVYYNLTPKHPKYSLDLKDSFRGLHSRILSIKRHPKGSRLIDKALERDTTIAILPLGISDGLFGVHIGRDVLLNGKRCKIIRVCLEHCILDVTGIPEAKRGDTVTFIGENGGDEITLLEIRDHTGWKVTEILTAMPYHSVNQLLYRNGELLGVHRRSEQSKMAVL